MNFFFGDEICLDIIKRIGKENLAEYSDEEDFILGIMLGYSRLKQCQRYLEKKRATYLILFIIFMDTEKIGNTPVGEDLVRREYPDYFKNNEQSDGSLDSPRRRIIWCAS